MLDSNKFLRKGLTKKHVILIVVKLQSFFEEALYLAADIGGTKTHAAFYVEENGEFVKKRERKYPSQEHATLEEILIDFAEGAKIKRMCLGIAGPIKDGICKATNLPWVIDEKNIKQALGVDEVYMINDLEANAWGIRELGPDEFYVLNGGREIVGNQALVSAGTGLGEAGLFYDGKEHLPFPCEGGHVDFAPRDEKEVDLLRYLMKKLGYHVSYERVLSGKGLSNLYSFLIDTGLEKSPAGISKEMEDTDPARVISKHGVEGTCPACVHALDWFCSIYGSEAGNTALKFMSIGGVYIGGGIAPKILDAMKRGDFMKGFVAKGRFEKILSDIPIKIVLNENTALLGAAYFCHYPHIHNR